MKLQKSKFLAWMAAILIVMQVMTTSAFARSGGTLSDGSSPINRWETIALSGSGYDSGNLLAAPAVFPLKSSANGRYLVDQNNVPFLIKGDSPQGLIALSPADQQMYFSSRSQVGINTIWVSLLCTTYSSICPSVNGYGGVPPFTTPGDLSMPNDAYFRQVDAMLNLAAQYNMVVFLGPIETGGWLDVLRSNGTTKAYNYGVYLGNRYKDFPNIIWLSGNDFQTWQNANDTAVVRAVANGIKSVDPNHLQTVELDYDTSGSLDDPAWASIINLDTAYSYYPQYAQVLKEYNRATMPVWFIEGVYEYQGYEGGYLGPYQLRNQEYWTQLSGSAGQLYGNANLFGFPSGWQNSDWQTSPGIIQFKYAIDFFSALPWYDLVPDQNHTVVTGGFGTFKDCCLNANSDYLTAARTSDGKLAVAYLPTVRTITVDMSKLSGTASARWYDPTNGTYTAISGSPFANSGTRQFTPPQRNSSGDGDWVLVLETNPVTSPTATPTGSVATPIPTNTPTRPPTSMLPTDTPTGTPTTVGTSITMGETNVLPNDDYQNGNLLLAQQTSLSQSGMIQSMSFYVTNAVGQLRLGIYDDAGGSPGTLRAQTNAFTPVVGWNTQPVQTLVSLPAGTYWLAYLPQSNDLHFRNEWTGTTRFYSYTFGPMPSTFSASASTGTFHFSLYTTINAGTLPTSMPTATRTAAPNNTPTRTPTGVLPSPTRTPTPSGTSIKIGETNILATDDFGNRNLLVAQQTTLSQSATIQSMSFYITSAVGRLRLGIYNDAGGRPGKLQATTGSFVPVRGWNTRNVITPVLLRAGTYWLVYLPESNDLHFRVDHTSGSARYYSYTYGPMPSTFSSSSTTGVFHFSFYATLTR